MVGDAGRFGSHGSYCNHRMKIGRQVMAGGIRANSWVIPVFALFVATFATNTAELIVAGCFPS